MEKQNSFELRPVITHGVSKLNACKPSVGSFAGRSPSMSKFLKRGVSKTSSAGFDGILVESPKEKKKKRLMFAPVAEVKEIEIHEEAECEEEATTEKQSSTATLFEDDVDFEEEDISDRIEKTVGSNVFKRFLFKIPLMHKAMILVLLPVLALFVLSAIDLRDSLELKQESKKAVEFTQLVRGTQQLAEIYLTTALWGTAAIQIPDPSVTGPYKYLFGVSQAQYAEFQELVESLSLDEIFDQKLWRDAIRGLERHELMKKKVLSQSISLGELEEYYVSTITALISSLAKGGSLTSDSNIRTAILSTYYQATLYVQWGLEMAGATIAAAVGGFHSDTSYRLYLKSVAATRKYTDVIVGMKEFQLIADHFYDNVTQDAMDIFSAVRDPLYHRQLHPTIDFNVLFVTFDVVYLRLSEEVTILADHTTEISQAAMDNASSDVLYISLGLIFLGVISCLLVALFVSSVNTMTGILQKEVETRQKTEKAVWRFFPQEFISYLNAPDVFHLRPGDRTRLPMTVMFAQIMNFSHISGDSTAEQTYDWLTDFVREMIPIVSQHGGFVDKTTGDGVMALFSTPEGAVHAALEMQAKVKAMNAFGLLSDDPPYDLGIGIHTGEVMLGLLGTRKRLEGTIISDTVNTASRIQGMCKFYGSKIVVSEEVASVVDVQSLGCRLLGEVKMKGKVSSLKLYDIYLMDEDAVRSIKEATVEGYDEALMLYQHGRFQECGAIASRWIEQCKAQIEDPGLRCRLHFAQGMGTRSSVPDGWSGEDIFSEK